RQVEHGQAQVDLGVAEFHELDVAGLAVLVGGIIGDVHPLPVVCILSTIFPIIIKWNSKIFHFENYRIFF
ncbi:MAG: hypothetical protein PHT39_08730, partial [Sphaerochaetaceae bacterium]|nr:hypothetical protein [Sphaerochaetaceae bacterium]